MPFAASSCSTPAGRGPEFEGAVIALFHLLISRITFEIWFKLALALNWQWVNNRYADPAVAQCNFDP